MRKLLYIFLIIIPVAYAINFSYAIQTGGTGGTFGDTFGAANAFFSGSALFMLIYAVILQREELSIVKDERNDTKELLRGQEEITRLQRSALEQQIFEQSFNSLLQQALDERARLSLQETPSDFNSRTHLQLSSAASRHLLWKLSDGLDINDREYYEAHIRAFSQLFLINLIVHLATMIDQTPITNVIKPPLRQLITSLLGPDICIAVLLFHGKSVTMNHEMRNFRQFIESYKVLDYVDDNIQKQYSKVLNSICTI